MKKLNSVTQINITKIMFRLLGFSKLSLKNRAAKNLQRSGTIAKPIIKHESATITTQSTAAKNFWRCGPRLSKDQQPLPRNYHLKGKVTLRPTLKSSWYSKSNVGLTCITPIHSVKFSPSNGDLLEYNGSQGANGSD